eukprot:CAMPEP_0114495522 /NCGR_PEP_ID=MMETSP0109-20121206/5258_1 /TAXON_ID=29199 /ORGANISM="Chlorarachnion reptans, Strain CCCM449" /LENGTH=42 /DNA_ID= /DNA_START= /DNA_END= /DNA_ORIENTATION=
MKNSGSGTMLCKNSMEFERRCAPLGGGGGNAKDRPAILFQAA